MHTVKSPRNKGNLASKPDLSQVLSTEKLCLVNTNSPSRKYISFT